LLVALSSQLANCLHNNIIKQGTGSPHTMVAPLLSFPGKTAPLAVLAAASLAGVDLEVKPDAKAAKDSPPVLTFPSGCAPKRHG
jgi:hypothetical protein